MCDLWFTFLKIMQPTKIQTIIELKYTIKSEIIEAILCKKIYFVLEDQINGRILNNINKNYKIVLDVMYEHINGGFDSHLKEE